MRTVVVTGGTGALGRAVVARFLSQGDAVIAPWIVAAERDALAKAHADQVERNLLLPECDVTVPERLEALAALRDDVQVLVNAAGGFGGGTPIHETDLELHEHLFRLNVLTAVATTRALAPRIVAAGGGSITNVASQAAIDCPPGLSAYSASKAAVIALTRTAAAELGPRGVRVNAVVPTTIDTPANRAAMPDADFGSWTPPERIAEVITWLASDAGATVRGGLIPV